MLDIADEGPENSLMRQRGFAPTTCDMRQHGWDFNPARNPGLGTNPRGERQEYNGRT